MPLKRLFEANHNGGKWQVLIRLSSHSHRCHAAEVLVYLSIRLQCEQQKACCHYGNLQQKATFGVHYNGLLKGHSKHNCMQYIEEPRAQANKRVNEFTLGAVPLFQAIEELARVFTCGDSSQVYKCPQKCWCIMEHFQPVRFYSSILEHYGAVLIFCKIKENVTYQEI